MSKNVFLLDKQADYKKLGINPNNVEEWEDGVRDNEQSNHFEWWYFDSILDDGTKVVVQFLSKRGRTIEKNEYTPTVFFKVTLPDGKQLDREYDISAKDIKLSKETCDVNFGKHFFKGNLKKYHIHVDLIKGMGADIYLDSNSTPYRPGTSYFQFEDESKYYTWLCVVPKGSVKGTLTIDGKTKEISGSGYHDHQWGSINFHKYWNHWFWIRQSFDNYSLLIFDFFASEEFGYKRFPIIFIQDNNGKIIFESNNNVKSIVKEHYTDDASGKEYPSKIHYEFSNNDTKVIYDLEAKKVIEKKGKNTLPFPMKLLMKTMGIDASYSRYFANGTLELKASNADIKDSGDLIYEIMFPGKTCIEMMNTENK